jgi:apolipoprotein D and lipocalin family protein
MKTFLSFFSTFFLASSVFGLPYVDISKYVGRWYQVYANPFSFYITENGGSCITADYQILDSSSISVLNSEIVKGKPRSIRAIGTIIDPNEPGKLTVKFENVPLNGTYWIYDIGPIENNQYQYSIVSDDQKLSLFVLTRDVENFQVSYDPKIRMMLSDLGFQESTLISTPQTNCSYF